MSMNKPIHTYDSKENKSLKDRIIDLESENSRMRKEHETNIKTLIDNNTKTIQQSRS